MTGDGLAIGAVGALAVASLAQARGSAAVRPPYELWVSLEKFDAFHEVYEDEERTRVGRFEDLAVVESMAGWLNAVAAEVLPRRDQVPPGEAGRRDEWAIWITIWDDHAYGEPDLIQGGEIDLGFGRTSTYATLDAAEAAYRAVVRAAGARP